MSVANKPTTSYSVNLLKVNDISAAIAAALLSKLYHVGSPIPAAINTGLASIIGRFLTENAYQIPGDMVSANFKEKLYVALAAVIGAFLLKKNVKMVPYAVTIVIADILGDELINLVNGSDKQLIGFQVNGNSTA
jgi:hypothetical protein